MTRLAVWFSAFLTIAMATSLEAADPERGRELAKRWCAACHVIGPGTTGGDAGPAFETIASRDWLTEGNVKNAIAFPHPPMPDLELSAPEYEDLGSYIMSLAE
jgi:mono/diheme cytochrome c family protein